MKFSEWRLRVRAELVRIMGGPVRLPRRTLWATRFAFEEGIRYQDAAEAIAAELR